MATTTAEEDALKQALQIASDCISEVPVMVIGSGLSSAYGVRGMGPLAEYLIEHVMPEAADIDRWDDFKHELARNRDLEEALQKVNVSEHLRQEIVHHTRRMILEDERLIYDKLISGETLLHLSHLFQRLFQSTHKVLNVVTTNYDRLVEYAACHARIRCNTGFTDGAFRHFQCQKSEVSHYTRLANFRCIDVWKVHGSVDWFQNATTPAVGLLDHATVPQGFSPLLVTPGVAKYSRTHQEPFRSVIAFADNALSSARGFLCVGYGFTDDHIEPKLIQRTSEMQPPIAILARTLRSGAKTFLSKHMHSRVVAFEKDGNGTRVYTERHKNGLLIQGEELWSLDGLLRKLRIL
jgi:hypothetical protein